MCWGARGTPHDAIDVAGELGVGDSEASAPILVDDLQRPSGIEFGGDLGEMREEGDAADASHALLVGRFAHPMLRTWRAAA